MNDRNGQPPANGYALSVDRVIDAEPEAIFDGFIAMYDSQRPDWVTGAELDLRPGGRWTVDFPVPDGPAFREERVITTVERPGRLAYGMRAIYPDAPAFATSVEVTIASAAGGQRVRLTQRGFPTEQVRDDFAGAWPQVLSELASRLAASPRPGSAG
jgi:uncharacterized protein YndB with AHSA1/START domain